MREFTAEQINHLYQFTRQHYVEWYDLQTELVDHLANDIEHIMDNNKDLSFEEAKKVSFKKFGVFGFSDVIEQKQNALSTYYWRLAGTYFLQFFKVPKILLTLFLMAVCYSILRSLAEPKYLLITFFVVVYVYIAIHLYGFHKKMKQKTKETNRKWLFEHNILNLGGAVCLAGIPIQLFGHIWDDILWTDNRLLIYSAIMVLMGLVTFILIKIVPEKLSQEMSKQFSEYKQIA